MPSKITSCSSPGLVGDIVKRATGENGCGSTDALRHQPDVDLARPPRCGSRSRPGSPISVTPDVAGVAVLARRAVRRRVGQRRPAVAARLDVLGRQAAEDVDDLAAGGDLDADVDVRLDLAVRVPRRDGQRRLRDAVHVEDVRRHPQLERQPELRRTGDVRRFGLLDRAAGERDRRCDRQPAEKAGPAHPASTQRVIRACVCDLHSLCPVMRTRPSRAGARNARRSPMTAACSCPGRPSRRS